MSNIYRIFEVKDGILNEIAFVSNKESANFYLKSCYYHEKNDNIFYFAEKINVEE